MEVATQHHFSYKLFLAKMGGVDTYVDIQKWWLLLLWYYTQYLSVGTRGCINIYPLFPAYQINKNQTLIIFS